MPYGVGLKDERPTSNIERPAPNENKYQIPNIQQLFPFLFSRFDTRNENLNQFFSSVKYPSL